MPVKKGGYGVGGYGAGLGGGALGSIWPKHIEQKIMQGLGVPPAWEPKAFQKSLMGQYSMMRQIEQQQMRIQAQFAEQGRQMMMRAMSGILEKSLGPGMEVQMDGDYVTIEAGKGEKVDSLEIDESLLFDPRSRHWIVKYLELRTDWKVFAIFRHPSPDNEWFVAKGPMEELSGKAWWGNPWQRFTNLKVKVINCQELSPKERYIIIDPPIGRDWWKHSRFIELRTGGACG